MGTVQEPVLAVTIAIFSFASIFVSLYMISAVFVVRKISLADYLMLLAWVRYNHTPEENVGLMSPSLDVGFGVCLFTPLRSKERPWPT
jgi:hypothetical protein